MKKISLLPVILVIIILILACSEKGRVEKNDLQEKTQKKIPERSPFIKGKRLTVLKEIVDATDLEIDGEELFVLDEVVGNSCSNGAF
jgi:hypothetical protein